MGNQRENIRSSNHTHGLPFSLFLSVHLYSLLQLCFSRVCFVLLYICHFILMSTLPYSVVFLCLFVHLTPLSLLSLSVLTPASSRHYSCCLYWYVLISVLSLLSLLYFSKTHVNMVFKVLVGITSDSIHPSIQIFLLRLNHTRLQICSNLRQPATAKIGFFLPFQLQCTAALQICSQLVTNLNGPSKVDLYIYQFIFLYSILLSFFLSFCLSFFLLSSSLHLSVSSCFVHFLFCVRRPIVEVIFVT